MFDDAQVEINVNGGTIQMFRFTFGLLFWQEYPS